MGVSRYYSLMLIDDVYKYRTMRPELIMGRGKKIGTTSLTTILYIKFPPVGLPVSADYNQRKTTYHYQKII